MLISKLKHCVYQLFTPGTVLKDRYSSFQELLFHDARCHEIIAELQDIQHSKNKCDLSHIISKCNDLSEHVLSMINRLRKMKPGAYDDLLDYHKKFNFYISYLLAPPIINSSAPYTISLNRVSEISKNVGNKAKNLALIKNNIGIHTPNGFAITTNSFNLFIQQNNLRPKINAILAKINLSSKSNLELSSQKLIKLILQAELPSVIKTSIDKCINKIINSEPDSIKLAVRSSAICEDGEFSFAGQYLSLLDINADKLHNAYIQILASKYTPEAIAYRIKSGKSDEEIAMSVLVMEMVNATTSGVIYTASPVISNNNENIHIYAIPGLGESLVSGESSSYNFVINPLDSYKIINKTNENSISSLNETFTLSDEQIIALAKSGKNIENFFQNPQDIEWSINKKNEIIILQTRPLYKEKFEPEFSTNKVFIDKTPLLDVGECASGGQAAGKVIVNQNKDQLKTIPPNTILVTNNTPPSLALVIDKLSAVIADNGSVAGHFSTVARENGIPLIVNTKIATSTLKTGQKISIDSYKCSVYKGIIKEFLQKKSFSHVLNNQFDKTLASVLEFITPLNLLDPSSKKFAPCSCRSMHDIIRFSHEKSVQTMFLEQPKGFRKQGVRKFDSNIALNIFLYDIDNGISKYAKNKNKISLTEINSIPFKHFWAGLSNPKIKWHRSSFDWKAFDQAVLNGRNPNPDSSEFASYGAIGEHYLHLNLRFGYHFTIIDAVSGKSKKDNYCLLRFAGGGGLFEGRWLRIKFISQVLIKLGYNVEEKGDLVTATLTNCKTRKLNHILDMLGRLLGATKLMDMALKDKQMVDKCISDFFEGIYDFKNE